MADSGSNPPANNPPGMDPISSPELGASSSQKRKADEMDSPEEQPTIKLIEVDPDGDLIIRVGAEYTAYLMSTQPIDIKVNRHVMSLGSPVFAKMLSSGFTEGEAGIINLAEDSPTAFLEYCNILHHKTISLDHLSGKAVWELALIADMRQSQHVLKWWILGKTDQAYAHIRKELKQVRMVGGHTTLVESKGTWFTIASLIEIAAVFSHAELFWDSTRYLFAIAKKGDDPTSHRKEPCLPATANPDGEDVHEIIIKAAQEYCNLLLRETFEVARIGFSFDLLTCQLKKHGLVQLILSDLIRPPDCIEDWRECTWRTLELVDRAAKTLSKGPLNSTFKQILESECEMMGQIGAMCEFCKRNLHAEFTNLEKRISSPQGSTPSSINKIIKIVAMTRHPAGEVWGSKGGICGGSAPGGQRSRILMLELEQVSDKKRAALQDLSLYGGMLVGAGALPTTFTLPFEQ
ncbi:hypothetical protein H2200_004985 [Cladophialophora chaetospira]|uniref:BTB domain-containing protein n=1 Tax=Cladophialophora chaetospira TaxID=386627 RepID=A0AA38XB38_9EURO|nr:hypothetical protein H2200_004985 [Cladophialophora chaetospira]